MFNISKSLNIFSKIIYKKSSLNLLPINDLSQTDGLWVSTGSDPQFLVSLDFGEPLNISGWVVIEINIEFLERPGIPQLYWDEGFGFDERKTIYLHFPINGVCKKIMYFHNPVKVFRLDPTDCEGIFKNPTIKIQSTSYAKLIIESVGPYFIKAIKSPELYLNFILNLVRLLFLKQFSAIKKLITDFIVSGSGNQAKQYLEAQLAFAKFESQDKSRKVFSTIENNAIFFKTSKKKKILIGLVEHFGDIVACEPVVKKLRKEYPDAQISWVVQSNYRELIDSNPLIDQTIAVECLTDWIKILAHFPSDMVVDLHVNGRICQQCRVTLNKVSGDLSITGDNHFSYGNLLAAFCRGAGINSVDIKPELYISKEIINQIDLFELPEKFIVIHAKSNLSTKDWNSLYWEKLVNHIISLGYDVIEVGLSPVIQHLEAHYFNFCGKTTLLQLAEIIRRSELFIGVESGPGHFANALESQAVILIGQLQSFKNYDPYSGPHKNIKFARNNDGPACNLSYDIVLDVVLEKLSLTKHPDLESMSVTLEPVSDPSIYIKESNKVKLIAFYLPQFHPIPENDAAWGKGFTEWTNVTKAKPFFAEQDQPRLPGEFGYYDLRLPCILENQSELAQAYGIYGFCYYYYWFNGRRLLNKPIDAMLLNKKPSMPFCFCWANENWTRRWDGMSKEVIVPQMHSLEDDRAFIRNLFNSFGDDRYIRVDGKPLLLIYRTDLLPNPKLTAELWRTEVKKAGFEDLYLVRCESNDPFTNPLSIGFDASYEVPTFILPDELKFENLNALKISSEFKGRIYDYEKIVNYYCNRENISYKRFRGPMLAWDNTPRHNQNALIFHGVTPKLYEKWLRNCVVSAQNDFKGDEKIVFLNAWNEWAEGSYLEPDLKNGYSFLESTRNAITIC